MKRRRGKSLIVFCCLIAWIGCGGKEDTTPSMIGRPVADSAAERIDAETIAEPIVESVATTESQAPAVSEEVAQPETDPVLLQRQVLVALSQGKDAVAYDLARQAMRLVHDDPQIKFAYGMVLGNRKRYPEAIKLLDEVAEASPDARLPAMGQTAEWMVRYGKWDEAERRFHEVLASVPEFPLVRRNLAMLLLRQGRRFEASRHLKFLCEIGDVQENELRALLSIHAPFPGDAEKDFLEPIGKLGAARKELGRGDQDSALEALGGKGIADAAADALSARLAATLGDFEATAKWEASIEDSDHAFPDVWFAKGLLAAHQSRNDQAVRCFAKCVLQQPTDHEAYRQLGQLLEGLGLDEEAEACVRRSRLIERTMELGAEMAATDARDGAKLAELISALNELRRPLEALAWQGVQVAYAQQASALSPEQVTQLMAELKTQREALLQSGGSEASESFLICGIDLDKISSTAGSDLPRSDKRDE